MQKEKTCITNQIDLKDYKKGELLITSYTKYDKDPGIINEVADDMIMIINNLFEDINFDRLYFTYDNNSIVPQGICNNSINKFVKGKKIFLEYLVECYNGNIKNQIYLKDINIMCEPYLEEGSYKITLKVIFLYT